ncbi:MAG: hypothetical protein QM582_14515 [Micropruina sp.]|uniref:hypothetical protein n=1 Tax=Micropruina sp. TaxID=2737536 RepID=UPI0039E64E5B
MSAEAATAKQIDYIRSLQADYAYLADAAKPDFAASFGVKEMAETYALEDLEATGLSISDRIARGEDVSIEDRKAVKAARRAATAEWVSKIADNESIRWDARLAALTASTDDLTKAQASDLIAALSLDVEALR